MAARSKARRRALDILFAADLRRAEPQQLLVAAQQQRAEQGQTPLNEYTVTLVEGVVAHQEQIDAELSTYAIGWTLDRMPAVDRAIARIGAFEVLMRTVPTGVAVSEAVAMASELSTDSSPKFINGLLSRIAEMNQGTDTAVQGVEDVPRVGFEPTLDGV